jgi:CheY-like chemotaxis protein
VNQPKRILLVDDEPSIRLLLRALLERAGYSVEVAEDGYVALSKISQSAPDLVITDLRMPNMNGFELLAVLRSRHPEILTIAISGEFIAAELNAGPIADAFFEKGQYSPLELEDKIAQLLQTPPQRVSSTQPGTLWTSKGGAPVMLTCTRCLRTFPIDLCNHGQQEKKKICIFCGAELEVEIVAIGVAPAP